MPKLPSWTPKKLLQELKKKGFQVDHTTGSHFILFHPTTGRRTVIPYHLKDLPKGTFLSILKQTGISREELTKSKKINL